MLDRNYGHAIVHTVSTDKYRMSAILILEYDIDYVMTVLVACVLSPVPVIEMPIVPLTSIRMRILIRLHRVIENELRIDKLS